jgi:hypothetical protein
MRVDNNNTSITYQETADLWNIDEYRTIGSDMHRRRFGGERGNGSATNLDIRRGVRAVPQRKLGKLEIGLHMPSAEEVMHHAG